MVIFKDMSPILHRTHLHKTKHYITEIQSSLGIMNFHLLYGNSREEV